MIRLASAPRAGEIAATERPLSLLSSSLTSLQNPNGHGRPRFSPEPGPRGRTQPRPATPAPKPRLTSPSAFQKNIGTRQMTRERIISYTLPSQPAAAECRCRNRQQTHKHPRPTTPPAAVIAMRCLLYFKILETAVVFKISKGIPGITTMLLSIYKPTEVIFHIS